MNTLSQEIISAASAGMSSPGESMFALAEELFPLHRSITGEGVRETLRILQTIVPLDIHEVPTGTQVFDWRVPQEWAIRGGSIRTSAGETVVDYADCNLHIAGYSGPVSGRMRLAKLEPHLISVPKYPRAVPFHSLHFQQGWAFCLADETLQQMRSAGADTEYDVTIDSELFDGSLTYGELLIPGELQEEVLVSTHVCHPSMANDNLSSISVASFLARELSQRRMRYSYRFLFIPATIGAMTWLALNQHTCIPRIKYGVVLACLGDSGPFTYKKSRQENAPIDLAAGDLIEEIRPFVPGGYDERQFNAPAFDLPMGRLTRTPNGEFPEYHTSADDLALISPQNLAESLDMTLRLLETADGDKMYVNQHPWCEPPLAKHGLYDDFTNKTAEMQELQQAVMWMLNLSDGKHSLGAIAARSKMAKRVLQEATARLLACGLLK